MDKSKALTKCMQLCSRKEYCISEIEQKLKTWELADFDSQEIIDQLIADKFIDEERYVRAFVNDKFKFNRWGRKKISYILSQKGVPGYLINQGLDLINESDYNGLVRQLMQEKAKKIKAETKFERNGKIANYMASRGFESNIIFQFLNSDEY